MTGDNTSTLIKMSQDLGEVVGSLRALSESVRAGQAEGKERSATMERELREFRHETRNAQQVSGNRVADLRRDVDGLADRFKALERPVHQYVLARARIGSMCALIVSAGGAAMWFAEPVRNFVVEHVLQNFWPPRHP